MFPEFAQACRLLLFIIPAIWSALILVALIIIWKATTDAH
jgi:hypothetical protein